MSFTFEMDIGKDILAIDIYNFIRSKQNYIGDVVLIYISLQSCSHDSTRVSNKFNRENTEQM